MGAPRRWTAEEDARIREMFAAGRADCEIAAALGRPLYSTRDRRRLTLGLKWRSRRKPAPARTKPAPVQDALLALLRARGPMTTAELARAGGRNKNSTEAALCGLHERGQAFPEPAGTLPRHGLRWTATAWWIEHNRGAFFQCARRRCRAAPTYDAREDAVHEFAQDMVPKVYQLARTYRPFKGTKFSSYMYKWAAKHVARDRKYYDLPAGVRCGRQADPDAFARARGARVTHLSHPLEDDLDVGGTLPDPRAPRKEYPPGWWDRVTADLRPTDRAVILARYRDHRTLQEIADGLGRTRECVRLYEARGLERLRDLIKQGKAPAELTEWDG